VVGIYLLATNTFESGAQNSQLEEAQKLLKAERQARGVLDQQLTATRRELQTVTQSLSLPSPNHNVRQLSAEDIATKISIWSGFESGHGQYIIPLVLAYNSGHDLPRNWAEPIRLNRAAFLKQLENFRIALTSASSSLADLRIQYRKYPDIADALGPVLN